MPVHDNIKFSEYIKQGFKRAMFWNKYKLGITTQPKTNNLDFLIDPKSRNNNRFFVLPFKNASDDATRYYFDKYYMSLVKIEDFNILIDNKPFFNQPVKNKQITYGKLLEKSRNDNCTTGNLLDYLYHQKYYKLICIDS